ALWLAEAFAASPLARTLRIGLRRDLRRTQAGLRSIIVLLALARVTWAAAPAPENGRPGAFIRRRKGADMRHVGRIVRFCAPTLRGRVRRLRAIVDALEAHVARMVRRLEAAIRALAPVVIAPLALLTGLAAALPAGADTS
ncbi:MAG: hypothetical protein NW200_08420, partial [Hyphomonadaceae bacterium]|nr:hypothetical protein [Hyphomonadaceae bacterium]